jgi:hypothetical protein
MEVRAPSPLSLPRLGDGPYLAHHPKGVVAGPRLGDLAPPTRQTVMPVGVTRPPVGGMPMSSPWWVPWALQRLTTLSPSASSSSKATRASGMAAR